VAEAAAQLDITEENLRVRAHRARGRVHDELVAAGWIDATGGTR
jgi:DNA-directed RNA polymerase specialized sigma24 family protein